MTQNVNLFLDEFQYHEPPYSGNFIVKFWLISLIFFFGLSVLVAAVWGAAVYWKQNVLYELSDIEKELQRVQESYPPRQIDYTLQNQVEFSRKVTENRRILLKYLSAHHQPPVKEKKHTFAMILAQIAQVRERKAWLRSVEVSGDELALSGLTLDYSVIPEYLKSISASVGKEFKSFRIEPEEDAPAWSFRVNTAMEEYVDGQSTEEKPDEGEAITAEKAFRRLQ